MSRMLRDETQDDPIVIFGARSLAVGGEAYANTASKFWSGLVDEVVEDYPGCDAMTLATTGSGMLTGDLMFPVNELQRELDKAEFVDLEEAIRQAVEELDMFGRPSAVNVTLYSGKGTVRTRELTRDYIDSQVFNYLLAWLFQWSGVPEPAWNNEFLSGKFEAADLARNLRYKMQMTFLNRHLSEGLFNRSVTLFFARHKSE